MKRIESILTVISAALCCLFLVLFLLSYCLRLPEPADEGDEIDAHASIAITSNLHIAISCGAIWFFNDDLPYTGSIIGLSDANNPTVNERIDWSWSTKSYGFEQRSLVGTDGHIYWTFRFGNLPGVYYRYFHWENEPIWWTLRMSLLYPIALFAVLPAIWIIRMRYNGTSED